MTKRFSAAMDAECYPSPDSTSLSEPLREFHNPWIASTGIENEGLFNLENLMFSEDLDLAVIAQEGANTLKDVSSLDRGDDLPLLIDDQNDLLLFENLNEMNNSIIPTWDADIASPESTLAEFDELTGSSFLDNLTPTYWADLDNDGIPTDCPEFVQEVEISSEPESINVISDTDEGDLAPTDLQRGEVRLKLTRSPRLPKRAKRAKVGQKQKKSVSKTSEKKKWAVNNSDRNMEAGIITCHECGKLFASTLTLRKHQRKEHHATSNSVPKIRAAKLTESVKDTASKLYCTAQVVLERTPMPKSIPPPTKRTRKMSISGVWCSICHEKFSCGAALRNHQIATHKLRVKKNKNGTNSDHQNSAICDNCQRTFSGKQALKLHQVVVHKLKLKNYKRIIALRSKKQQCSVCGHKSTNIYHLRRHQRLTHSLELPSTQAARKEVLELDRQMKGRDITTRVKRCDICNEVVDGRMSSHKMNAHGLKLHNGRHKIARQSVRCGICRKIMRKQYLNDHMDAEHAESNKILKCHIKRNKNFRLRLHAKRSNTEGRDDPEDKTAKMRRVDIITTAAESSKILENTHNSDLNDAELQWMREKIKNADKNVEMFSHILQRRCAVKLVDLRDTILKVLPITRKRKRYLTPPRPTPNPQASCQSLDRGVASCMKNILAQTEINLSENQQEKNVHLPPSSGSLLDRRTEIESVIQAEDSSPKPVDLPETQGRNRVVDAGLQQDLLPTGITETAETQGQARGRLVTSSEHENGDVLISQLHSVRNLDLLDLSVKITETQTEVNDSQVNLLRGYQNEGIIVGARLLQSSPDLILDPSAEITGAKTPEGSLGKAVDSLHENQNQTEIVDISLLQSSYNLDLPTDMTQTEAEENPEMHYNSNDSTPSEPAAGLASNILIRGNRDEHEDMDVVIQEKLKEILDAVVNITEVADYSEDLQCNRASNEVPGPERYYHESQCQPNTTDDLNYSFDNEVKIDDADMDYHYLDHLDAAAIDELSEGVEVMKEIPDHSQAYEKKDSTSENPQSALKIMEDEKLLNPDNCKVFLTDVETREVQCVICEETVQQKYLERHKRIDHILECHICSKPVHLDDYRSHGTTHVGRLECEIEGCSFKANTAGVLWQHMNKHLGIRPLYCDICGKNYASYGTLHAHYQGHIKDKKYKCELCEKSYVTERKLKSHKKLTHRDDN